MQSRGWSFIIAVFLLFTLAGLLSSSHDRRTRFLLTRWSPFARDTDTDTITEHPITRYMDDAKVEFTSLLERQSKTLPEAVTEYRRRHGRAPPRGFGQWWEFAKAHNFKLVDEFDAVVEDLAPFWNMTSQEMRRRTRMLGKLPSVNLVRIENGNVSEFGIEEGTVNKDRIHRSLGFRVLLENFVDKLPNMDFAINSIAEGRVLVPWEHLQLNVTQQDPSELLDKFTPDWQGHGNVWEAYRRTCPPGTAARQLYSSYRNLNAQKSNTPAAKSTDAQDQFTFVKSVEVDYDFCKHPWARYTQGHFFSDWRTIPFLAPILSPSKARGFSDIRIPSHYYRGGSARYTYGYHLGNVSVDDVDEMEMPWDMKTDRIFWRGATTGGGSTPSGFTPTYQRHRFLRMAHENAANNVTIVHPSPAQPDSFVSTTVPAKGLNGDIMDVAFVSALGSYPGGEEELRKAHRFAESVPLGEHWSHKYLVDLDGMSYSGRFMALMASDSAVIKSTVYKEYFSDWLQPWLHYIPLSASYAEVYNIHAYFTGPTESAMSAIDVPEERMDDWDAVKEKRDAELRQLARAGKQWKHTLGRVADMEVYVYRLCLEYARLWADDRNAMEFVL